jgi:Raf kinase inhibitor-like YbhB/YbcL family protein
MRARGLFLFALAIVFCQSALFAQPEKQTKVVPVTGSFYEVGKLEPSVARIKTLKTPVGFQIAKFAEIENPRMLVVAPDGTIYVSQRTPGTLTMLKDTDGDGAADVQKVVAQKEKLHGIALHNGKMYIMTVRELYSADVKADGTLGELKLLADDYPDAGQHPNRTLAVGPDNKLYISVGSTCNACDESNVENATMLQTDLDGKNRRIFASGLRNTIGFGWHPTSRRFWGWDQGIDWLGDDVQKEEFNELVDKQKYGWAYVYEDGKIYPHGNPPATLGLTSEDWAKQSRNPTLMHTAHSAGMQMTFYTGAMFPAEYKNDAFIALRGSWNRNPPSGYEVVRIRFDQTGTPTKIEPFVTGFLVKGGAPDGKDAHFARIAGVAQMPDGSLLVSDDTNNIIYRVTYGKQEMPAIMNREQISMMLPETTSKNGQINVRSDAFQNNAAIPNEYSAYYQDASPQLSWSGVPSGAKSIIVMMEDPDAGLKPTTHWLVANIPANATSLAKNLPKTDSLSAGGVQGGNIMGKIGYYGPRPPAGDKPHKYHFQVFALDTTLNLPAGFNRQALLDAMKGRVLAKGELVGTYQRQPDVRDKQ